MADLSVMWQRDRDFFLLFSLPANKLTRCLGVQMWIAWPFALYIGERIYGLFRGRSWDTQVMGASILDPGVLTLELSKPPGFSHMCAPCFIMKMS